MSGAAILFIIIALFLVMSIMGVWCYFCFGPSGGRSFTIMDAGGAASAPVIHIVKRRKCNCSDKFKGLCTTCDGPDFGGDDRGEFTELTDFSDFGGDKGLGESNGDPIRGALGNSSNTQNSASEPMSDPNMDRVVYVNDYY